MCIRCEYKIYVIVIEDLNEKSAKNSFSDGFQDYLNCEI